MAQKNPYIITTITTFISAIIFLLVTYFRTNKLDFIGLLIFIIVFWIVFFLIQMYFSKK